MEGGREGGWGREKRIDYDHNYIQGCVVGVA